MRIVSVCQGLQALVLAGAAGLVMGSPCAIAAAHAADTRIADAGEAVGLSLRYSAEVLLIPVGRIDVSLQLGAAEYALESELFAAGPARLLRSFGVVAEARGRLLPEGTLRAEQYAYVEQIGTKVRNVAVDFSSGTAMPTAEPVFSSWGVPPASREDRTGTLDPMAAMLSLSRRTEALGEAGCSGSIPVFDGKARYDLRLEARGYRDIRTPAWRGEALVCDAFYEPVSGYDPEDYPSEADLRRPLTLWLAPVGEGATYLPVRVTAGGRLRVTLELSEIAVASR